jgi:hypothetical protein
MILQTVRNGCVKFGGHVEIEVSYKILQLEVLKESPIWTLYLIFNRGCFEDVLMKNTLKTLGIKHTMKTFIYIQIHYENIQKQPSTLKYFQIH